ncbi:NADH-quinone oxidoreductase subunit NuoG [Candidatus Schneideria nysicola]|uniref:NADH-quinone oxidoreductase subunit NuoG n=1 Tax=Candidatus Schneideria nysicola TaxID=1081631 RepID=UPI001CAA4C63|nr:NADH-quinone oxidoreductase subunit NuoG [Candidatus Schneideria nysicola]UAJ66051.1 NADH-quinone oxidoreductase subunit NuoG [Candidatus Schneideria nysicola]
MALIYIDGKKYEVNESDNLLKICLSLGLDLPYFCWHPVLGSIGSCRQCAIKQHQNIHDDSGKIVMACMSSAIHGLSIYINNEEIKQFRKNIIELMMTNHPHDCPVCEEGGHCHLQDMTVMIGHSSRRYRFPKRIYRNQNLGPFINHEMNRCITCYRCVRYYKDYADGKDFGVYGVHNKIYFGRLNDGKLENEFSGNLIEICPTGVFTDKTASKRYNRKWDMKFSPSICQQCSVGCNIILCERGGELKRIDNRYNGEVNHYFLCDLGRFGYGYMNNTDRPNKPIQRKKEEGEYLTLTVDKAIEQAKNILRQSKNIIGIGSPRASMESNFALRQLVGVENFYTGISKNEHEQMLLILNILQKGGMYTPSLREIESYDSILILGEDITQTGARMALAVRQAIKRKSVEIASSHAIAEWHTVAAMNVGNHTKYPLFITHIDQTSLDDIATWSYYAPIDDQARLGFAIAHLLDHSSPLVQGFDRMMNDKISVISQALSHARKPLIISGSSMGSTAIIAAAANIARALRIQGKHVGISFTLSNVNSMGLALIGGNSIEEALNEIEKGKVDTLIILENDLYRHALKDRIDLAIEKVKTLIVLDHQKTNIQDRADLILSAANSAESSGTVINNEGRAQRFFQAYKPNYYDNQLIRLESWRWLYSLLYKSDEYSSIKLDKIIDDIALHLPHLADIKKVAPNETFRIHGKKLSRAPYCYSGRTATHRNDIHETPFPQDEDSMFNFSMEGNHSPYAPQQYVAFAWAPGWNSPQSWNKFQDEVGGHLRYGDPGIRLLDSKNDVLDWFSNIPASFHASQSIRNHNNSWYIVPYLCLFGSEETSQNSPVIKNIMPKPYLIMNEIDVMKLGCKTDPSNETWMTFHWGGKEIHTLPVRISTNLSTGQVGLPLGLPGLSPILSGRYLYIKDICYKPIKNVVAIQ